MPRAISICLSLLLIPGFLALAGCLVLPTSVRAPLPHDRIDTIQLHTSTRQSVSQLIGEPEVTRAGGKIWIYSAGHMGAVLLIFAEHLAGEELYMYEWLFLRFDDEGKVIEKELVAEKNGCTQSGYCLQRGWVKKNNKYRLSDEITILIQSTDNHQAQPVDKPYCRVYLYYLGQKNFFLRYFTTSIKINESGPYITDENTYARIDLPAGQLTFSLPGNQKHRFIRYNPGYDCPSGQIRYIGLSLTIDDEIFKKEFRPDEMDIILLDPAVATEEIKGRNLIVNP